MHINCSFQNRYSITKHIRIKDFITIHKKFHKKRGGHTTNMCPSLWSVFQNPAKDKIRFALYIFFVLSARIALSIAITATPTSANTAHHIVA